MKINIMKVRLELFFEGWRDDLEYSFTETAQGGIDV